MKKRRRPEKYIYPGKDKHLQDLGFKAVDKPPLKPSEPVTLQKAAAEALKALLDITKDKALQPKDRVEAAKTIMMNARYELMVNRPKAPVVTAGEPNKQVEKLAIPEDDGARIEKLELT